MKYFILSFFLIQQVIAAPESLEVWFLSAHKKAQIENQLKEPLYVFRSLTAELECQEMGEYCFDPQYGLYKKNDADKAVKFVEETPSLPAARSVDRNLINCDSKNFFDVFCGKAQAVKAPSYKLDLWIDTSSSMREMDFSDKQGDCFRKSLVRRLDNKCKFNQSVNVMMFDTSIKQAGTMDSLCQNQGLNDQKRMIDWIERSDAKKLVIITDLNEYQKEFADYIESKKGKLRGEKDPLVASELLNLVDDLARSCR